MCFIANPVKVLNLEEAHYLGQFLNGLRPNIEVKIREDIIQDVNEAVKWAGQIDRELSFENDRVFWQSIGLRLSSFRPEITNQAATPPSSFYLQLLTCANISASTSVVGAVTLSGLTMFAQRPSYMNYL